MRGQFESESAYLADIYRKMRCYSKRPEAITIRLFGRTVPA